jgi:hypothetical protein
VAHSRLRTLRDCHIGRSDLGRIDPLALAHGEDSSNFRVGHDPLGTALCYKPSLHSGVKGENQIAMNRPVGLGNEKWSSASLRITGDTLRPDQITVALGIDPTRSGLKGERISSRNDAIRRTSFWLKTSPLPDERPLHEHLEWLLDSFEPKHQVLSLISKEHSCDLFCGFSSENGQGGACLGTDLLGRLAGFGVPLVLDLYPPERHIELD